ncbi:protein GLUTAMINE DUMPER 5-like [Humulus lupulus]|uniref:protein GLUTAMINE DUMPER 5-like n=1 Tax=Humulus lupulus TaxID=3486 RepID=UPI002B400D82|nr:protein GLUTAMINE DUMPER 5-like [Humulus lupulus]
MRTVSSMGVSSSMEEVSTFPPSPATSTVVNQRSPWHSPVPYLFGGLAAMLGLIAFALLILACSYWRLNSEMDDNDGERDDARDLESGSGTEEKDSGKGAKVYEEKFLVIMAGDEKPTFLATPVCAKVSSFGEKPEKIEGENHNEEKENSDEKVKEVIVMMTTTNDHDHHQAHGDEETRESQ